MDVRVFPERYSKSGLCYGWGEYSQFSMNQGQV